MERLFEQFMLQYNLILRSLQIIQETILFAPVRINPALIQPVRIYEILSEIKLPSDRQFPLSIQETQFATFLSLCKLEVHIKFSTVIFAITIPVLSKQEYFLYKTHVLPIQHLNNYATFLTNVNPYFIAKVHSLRI